MKTIVSIILLVVINGFVFAGRNNNSADSKKIAEKSKTAISGKIVDEISGEALAGVEIVLLNNNKKTYTDFDGNFTFSGVEPGNYSIKVNYISYREKIVNIPSEKLADKLLCITLKSVEK